MRVDFFNDNKFVKNYKIKISDILAMYESMVVVELQGKQVNL